MLSCALVLLMLGMIVPASPVSAASSVTVCGHVVNKAGWDVTGANVSFQLFPTFGTAGVVLAATGADGRFEATGLVPDADYVVLIAPPADASGYRAWTPTDDSGNPTLYSTGDAPSAACPSGAGFDLGGSAPIALDAPGRGFVQVKVVDGVSASSAPIVGANVTTTFGKYVTDATGVARGECLLDASTVGLTVTLGQALFLPSVRTDDACADGAPTPLVVDLWRTPVVVAVEATDATTRTTTPAGPQTESGLANAAVSVTRVPAGMLSLSGAPAALCGASGPDVSVGVSTSNVGPYHCASTTDANGTATLALPWSNDASTFRIAASASGFATRAVDLRLTSTMANTPTTSNAASDKVVAVESPVVANAYARLTMVPATPTDPNANVSVAQLVTDYAGALAGVTVTFDGPSKIATTTGADGVFHTSVVGGFYNLTLQDASHNVRTCTAWVNDGGAGLGVLNVTTPSYCFQLVGVDKAAVSGDAFDVYTGLPIADGLQFCAGSTCATPNAAGHYSYEVPAGSTMSIQSSDWSAASANCATTAVAADQILTCPPSGTMLGRVTKTLDFAAQNATTNAPIASARLCVTSPSGHTDFLSAATTTCDSLASTDSTGVRAITSVPWTKRATTPTYDVGSIGAVAEREATSPHYARGATACAVLDTDAAPACTILLSEAIHAPTAVSAVDAHTGANVPASITATETTSGYACGPVCTGTSPAALDLYVSPVAPLDGPLETYALTADASATNYVVNSTAPAITAGATVPPILLPRTTTYAAVQVLDAHTGGPIQYAHVRVVGGSAAPKFDCVAAGAPQDKVGLTTYARVCEGWTLSNGTVSPSAEPSVGSPTGMTLLNVPWSTTPNEECFQVDAGQYLVSLVHQRAPNANENQVTSANGDINVDGHHFSGDTEVDQELVDFQSALSCQLVPIQSHSAAPLTFTVFVSRVGDAVTGDVTSGLTGQPVKGVTITAANERALPTNAAPSANAADPLAYSAFACDPSATNSSARFPQCAGAQSATDGSFALTLPELGLSGGESVQNATTTGNTTVAPALFDDTWDLKASAPGYFDERIPFFANLSQAGQATPDAAHFTLWPKTFTATLTFAQRGQAACGADYAGDIIVTLTDLETGQAYSGIAAKGNTCTVTIPNVAWERFPMRTANGATVGSPNVELTRFQNDIVSSQLNKTTDPFLVTTTFGDSAPAPQAVGYALAQLGPAATTTYFETNDTSGDGKDVDVSSPFQAQVSFITGTLHDSDAKVGGAANVTLTATKQGNKPCTLQGTTITSTTGVSGPDGSYTIPVFCPGTYTVQPSSTSYQPVAAASVTVRSTNFFAVQDFTLARTRTTFRISVVNPVFRMGAAQIAPTGVDVSASLPTQTTSQFSDCVYTNVPWGYYQVTPATPGSTQTPPQYFAPTTIFYVAPPGTAQGTVMQTAEPTIFAPVVPIP